MMGLLVQKSSFQGERRFGGWEDAMRVTVSEAAKKIVDGDKETTKATEFTFSLRRENFVSKSPLKTSRNSRRNVFTTTFKHNSIKMLIDADESVSIYVRICKFDKQFLPVSILSLQSNFLTQCLANLKARPNDDTIEVFLPIKNVVVSCISKVSIFWEPLHLVPLIIWTP